MILPEVTIPMYSICTLQVFFVLFQWINMVSRKADRIQVRFLVLTLTYLGFNISWISFLSTLSFTTWKEIPTIGYLGILMIGYTCFYISKEIGLKKPKLVAIELSFFLSIIYGIQQFSKIHLPTYLFDYLVVVLIIIVQIVTLGRAVRLIQPIIRTKLTEGRVSPINMATLIIACIYCFSPVIFALVSEAYVEFVLINAPFIIIGVAYTSHHVNKSKQELLQLSNQNSSDTLNGRFEITQVAVEKSISEYSKLNSKERNERITELLSEFDLTDRELEIAVMILNGTPTKIIADQLNLSYNTVRWHISNLSDKVGVDGIRQFRNKFQKIHYPEKKG